jgi:hypothetical protein
VGQERPSIKRVLDVDVRLSTVWALPQARMRLPMLRSWAAACPTELGDVG